MTSTPAELEPIRLILEDVDLTGWVHTQGQRMTDILQAGEPFAFLPAGGDPSQWTEIFPDDIVLAVPPPHVSPPDMRLPRNQHGVAIRAGTYRIAGTAHLRPGEQDDPMLRATRRFLPVTEATFGRDDKPDEQAETVIVNLRRTSEFRISEPRA
jgi:hypothetical protein